MSKCVDLKNKLWLIPDNNQSSVKLLYFCDEKDCNFSVYSTLNMIDIGKLVAGDKIQSKCEDF